MFEHVVKKVNNVFWNFCFLVFIFIRSYEFKCGIIMLKGLLDGQIMPACAWSLCWTAESPDTPTCFFPSKAFFFHVLRHLKEPSARRTMTMTPRNHTSVCLVAVLNLLLFLLLLSLWRCFLHVFKPFKGAERASHHDATPPGLESPGCWVQPLFSC